MIELRALRRVMPRAALAAVVVALGGACNSMVAPPSDYSAYRATRVAPTVKAQLRAAAAYLQRYPDGAFRDEVTSWFGQVEPLFYATSADSSEGMQGYLDTLPRGPHAAAAEQRRDALLAAQRSEAGEGISKAGALFEQRLARAAEGRENVLSAYAAWVARLLEFDGWGRPLESAKEPFASIWSADPKAVCTAAACSKTVELPYELEVGGKPQSYVCTLAVTLRREKGRVVEAVVGGPDLFARLIEAHQASQVDPSSEARVEATAWLVEFTSGASEGKLPRARCSAAPTAPSLMLRQCDGYKLELVPRTGTGVDDRVVIRGRAKL